MAALEGIDILFILPKLRVENVDFFNELNNTCDDGSIFMKAGQLVTFSPIIAQLYENSYGKTETKVVNVWLYIIRFILLIFKL